MQRMCMINSTSRVQLTDVSEIIMGQSPKGETYNAIGEGMPLLNGPTEFGSSHPTPALWTTAPTKVCRKGDLLFCVRGSTTGRMNWADREYCVGRGVGAFRAKTDSIDTKFIYYTLLYELPRLLSLSAGSVFPNLARQDFESFSVSWPDKNDRSAIASILGALDEKIELNRKMNETLEAMARAIFKSWFVDFDPIPGFGPHKEWQDSPLGRIPQGSKVGTIGDIIELAYGKALKEDDRQPGQVPVYGSNGQVGCHNERLVDGHGIVVGRKGNPGIITWVPTDFTLLIRLSTLFQEE
jgi:type I restriction enzyme S subunit